MAGRTRLLVTGFGPFPSAPENPTERLIHTLATAPGFLGAVALKAVVLPTEYRRSWEILRRAYARFDPEIVVHFGLYAGADAIHVETVARNQIDQGKPDASGKPLPERPRRSGPDELLATLSAHAIAAATMRAGFPAAVSQDAGSYVCNATLYRSLAVAPRSRHVGFVHVPSPSILSASELERAARIVLQAALNRAGRRATG